MKEEKKSVKLNIAKGHHGYLRSRKIKLALFAFILLLGAAGMVIIGVIVAGDRKNLMSLLAILTSVPMAMQLVSLVALAKFHGRPDDEFEEIGNIVGNGVMDTEFVIGDRDGKSIAVDYAVFTEEEILLFTSDTSLSVSKTEEYLHRFLRLSEVDCEMHLYNNLRTYKKRLEECPEMDRETCSDIVLRREGVFRAISM